MHPRLTLNSPWAETDTELLILLLLSPKFRCSTTPAKQLEHNIYSE